MKYYLIKTPNFIDDCDISIWFQDETLQCPNEVVELTEEEVKAIANEKKHLTSSSDYISGCDKLRKVLE